jgi:ABC-type nitrate/sulfonate/bicarbonate transport system ATPase subunit
MVEGAKEHAARLEQERGISGFNVRVGTNTRLVVVGEAGIGKSRLVAEMRKTPAVIARPHGRGE